ncbi:MAG: carboxypeptidase-like regulatory domain-containing protein [Prolixibacteraceae bacterium]|nr:carboxypeptidase-like regulatory domain-containing protein [Prolixibacteraceae bacterium]
MYRRFIILTLFLLCFFPVSYAQKVSGTVKEKNEEPIPYANVWLKGTYQGTMTDDKGHFSISSPKNDTISISSVGFITQEIPIDPGKDNYLSIYLKEQTEEIKEVTIKPEIPRAIVLFNEIQKHKKENREKLNRHNKYKSVETTTVYVAIDTLSKVIQSFGNMNDVTIKLDGQDLRFSPIYLSEKDRVISGDSTIVVNQDRDGIFPRINQTLENVIISRVTVNIDFYKDQIVIMDRGFISPLDKTALSHYNLYLSDSTVIDSIKYFHFTYSPKNKYDPLFNGHFTIEDGSFALTEIDAFIAESANLNFINGFKGHMTYKKMIDGSWFYDEQNVGVNMSLILNKTGDSKYSSKRIDNVSKGNWLVNRTTKYSTSNRLNDIKASAWKKQPEFAKTSLGVDDYSRVDKLKEHSIVKNIDKLGGMALTGYYNMGKIDVGPVFDIYSTNTIEGQRFSVPLRTSEQMFKHYSIGGFIGYGTKVDDIKYGINLVAEPFKSDKFIARFNYSDDYILVSQDKFRRFIKNNPNNKGTGNFVAIFTSREKNPYLKEEKSMDFRFEYNTPGGFHIETSPYYLRSTSTAMVPFKKNGENYSNYKNYGLLTDVRFSFGQAFDKFFFDRIFYVNVIPVVHLSLDMGQTLLPEQKPKDGGFYAQANASIQGRLTFGQMFMNYIVSGGFLYGDAPYDLLDQPAGSMSLGFSKDRYNLLHFATFAHNLYTDIHFHINGGGIILNRVPLIKKLKLREVLSVKCHYGDLNSAYKGVFDLPEYYHNEIKKPYAEVGIGITNICKIIRIEYVHQVVGSYMNRGFTDNDGIFLRMETSF